MSKIALNMCVKLSSGATGQIFRLNLNVLYVYTLCILGGGLWQLGKTAHLRKLVSAFTTNFGISIEISSALIWKKKNLYVKTFTLLFFICSMHLNKQTIKKHTENKALRLKI